MKLKSLKLKHFLTHKSLDLEFNHVNIFTGANGAGKSSIKDAILYALTGKINRNPINFAFKSCEAVLSVDPYVIKRRQTKSSKKLTINDNQGIQDDIDLEYGLSSDQMEALIETSRFINMSDKARKEVIFKTLNLEINEKNLIEWLSSRDEETDWEKVLKDHVDQEVFTSTDEVNRKYFERIRRSAKQTLADFSAKFDRYIELPEVDIRQKGAAKKLLDELQKELKKLYQLKGEKSALPGFQRELVNLKSKLARPDNSDKITGLSDESKDLEVEKTSLGKDREVLMQKKTEISTELNILKKRKGQLSTLCDECQQEISAEHAEKVNSQRKEQMAALSVSLKKLEEESSELERKLEFNRCKISKNDAQLCKLKSEGFSGDRKILEQEYDGLLKQKQALEKIGDIDKEIATTEARIETGKKLLSDITTVENAEKEKAALEEQIALTENEIKYCDLLEKAYSAKGVKSDLTKQALDDITSKANELLKDFGYGNLSILTERGTREVFEIQIGERPFISFSRAERQVISAILQIVISDLSNARLLILDDVDMFVGETKNKIIKTVLSNLSRFDTVILFKAGDEKPPSFNSANVTQFFLNGKLEVIQ